MTKIIVIIERAADGTYSAYGQSVDGIWGMGDSAEAAKASALQSLALFLEHNPRRKWPKVFRGEYELVFKFDVESLFNYYKKIFTHAGLERITGINQRLLQHYASGLKKPRPVQAKKIEYALHDLGRELLALQL
ncbi:MAG: type II toxin-antitoxin system HicB family antitoxin [Chitinophagaceae bacterium]|nr:type II toxin-antitoxin system HicB family antitoxin [Chitinophagaceae bacterium]